MARYLIPKPIQRQYEFFPGWGWRQIGLVLAGGIAAVLWFLITSLLRLPVLLRLLPALVPLAAGAGLAFPPPNERPLYERLLAGARFRNAPRRFVYDWNAKRWPD